MNDYQSKKAAENNLEDSSITERQNKNNSKDNLVNKFASLQKMENLTLGRSIADSVSLSGKITKLAQGRTIADSVSLSERVGKLAQVRTIADSVALSEKVVKLAQGNSVAEWANLAKSIKKTNNSKISEKLLIPAISGLIVAQVFNSNLPNLDFSSPLIKQLTNIQRTIGNDYLHSFIKDEDYDYVNSFLSNIQSEVERKETDSNIASNPDVISTQAGTPAPDKVKHTLTDNHQLSSTQLYDNLIEIFNLLPSPLRKGITFFVTFVLIPAIGTYLQEKVLIGIHGMESYAFSLANDKPITKHEIVNSGIDIEWNALSQFRVITGDNVRLRTSPSMNSEVIEYIGKNTVVAILESKERQWLLVQVKSGDELITGWITRTYTKPIKG